MTCHVFVDRIPDYLSGELEPEGLRDLSRHHDACPACQAYLRAYEATVTLARQAFDDGTGLPASARVQPGPVGGGRSGGHGRHTDGSGGRQRRTARRRTRWS